MAKAAGSSSSSKQDVFNVDRIRRLIDLMKEYELSEVDLRQEDQQIRLVRGGVPVTVAMPAPVAAATAAVPVSSPVPASPPAGADLDGPHIKIIKAPMVGTYYSKPNPKAEDFIKVGSVVTSDTVVCIIEAMKVFNEIPAEISGKVVEVLVSNEESVDFGRPLFKINTRG